MAEESSRIGLFFAKLSELGRAKKLVEQTNLTNYDLIGMNHSEVEAFLPPIVRAYIDEYEATMPSAS